MKKKVWIFSSENDKNVKIAMRHKKWGYKKSTKSHGGIDVGDYIMLYSKESKNIMCVGIITNKPKKGFSTKIWEKEHFDCVKFDIKKRISISLSNFKEILNIQEDINLYCKLLLPYSPSNLIARDALKIIHLKEKK